MLTSNKKNLHRSHLKYSPESEKDVVVLLVLLSEINQDVDSVTVEIKMKQDAKKKPVKVRSGVFKWYS